MLRHTVAQRSIAQLALCMTVFLTSHITAYPMPAFRRATNDQQMLNNRNVFTDSSSSEGNPINGAPQTMNIMPSQSRVGQNKVVMARPPLGSGTQGELNQVQDQGRSQTGTEAGYNSNNTPQGGPNMTPVLQTPQEQNAMNSPKAQVSGSSHNEGIQQSVSGSYMFNPGKIGAILQAPPGTGNSQFNNNMGSRNSMLNQFGGNGLSVDPSNFFRPKQNPDGTISGAAGNAVGPPTVGPMVSYTGGMGNMAASNNNDINNNNNYNAMFGPPSFFMNPGSSFGQK